MHNKTLYWLCQIVGWSIYMLFSFGMFFIFGGEANIAINLVLLQVVIGLSSLLFSHLFRLYAKRHQWTVLKPRALVPRVILSLIILSFLTQTLIHVIIYIIYPINDLYVFSWVNFLGYTSNTAVVLLLWMSIYFIYHFIQNNRKNEIEKLELKAALQEAELMILKNQINPHFLFNALNNIRSLILSDQDRARSMVTHISDLLRYSIQFNASEKVTVAEEMEIVRDYLQLESIQFNDRLAYVFNIDDNTKALKIPPMAIQLLVENAIKHGLSAQKNGGFIRVESSCSYSWLNIKVTNSGQLGSKKKREGIGLKNLVERMKILFGEYAEFKLENSSADTVTASLKIPVL